MTDKSEAAFRTISEAAEEMGVPAHVLRFWETRFPQLQPLKRAGGRRYYRPADMAMLRRIKGLLHDNGLTIRGAQLALAGKGVASVPRTAAPASSTVEVTPATAATPQVPSPASPPLPAIDRQALIAIRNRLVAALAA